MKHICLVAILGLLAYQSGPITPVELTAHPYALRVDTTGIHELAPVEQQMARAALAGKRAYIFSINETGTIRSEQSAHDGAFAFTWSLSGDSLHINLITLAGTQNKGYALSREGTAIVLSRGHYKAWLRPLK